jgi:hypothetical protein
MTGILGYFVRDNSLILLRRIPISRYPIPNTATYRKVFTCKTWALYSPRNIHLLYIYNLFILGYWDNIIGKLLKYLYFRLSQSISHYPNREFCSLPVKGGGASYQSSNIIW